MKALWNFHDGEPWMVNPELAVWNPRRKRRRRKTTSKRRKVMAYRRRHRRRRRSVYARRRRARRNVYAYANRPRRRRRSRRRSYARRRRNVVAVAPVRRRRRRRGGRRRFVARRRRGGFRRSGGGLQGQVMEMLNPQAVLAGVGAAVAVGLALPWLQQRIPQLATLSPEMKRVAQAGVAIGGAIALNKVGVIDRSTAKAVGTFGVVFAVMGLVSDLGLLERFGLPGPRPVTVSTPPPGMMAGFGAYRYALGPGSLDPGADALAGIEDVTTFGA